MRPLNSTELSSFFSTNESRCWRIPTHSNSIIEITNKAKHINGRRFFTFDRVFSEKSKTDAVYEGVAKNMIDSVMGGLNGTIFAYGQTSSGKTYTMQGGGSADRDTEGIVHMAAKDIFHYIQKHTARNRDNSKIYCVRVSYIEIYNDEVRDLLVTKESGYNTSLDSHRRIFLDVNEMVVTSYDSLLDVLFAGEKK